MLGRPIRFAPGTTVDEATRILRHAVEALRDELHGTEPVRQTETAAAVAG
jgi:hypothetical protein